MKKLLLLLVAVAGIATARRDPPLIPSCDPCSVNQSFTIDGSGLAKGNTLDVVVVGSPVPVTCTSFKDGSFTCTTSVPLAGTFNIVAYSIGNQWVMIGNNWVTVQ